MEAIHTVSAGVPRLINIICDAALVHGFADELAIIGPEVVQDVARDMAPMLHSNGVQPSADTQPSAGMEVTPDMEERLAAMERRLTVMEERFAAWGTDVQLMALELADLQNRAGSKPVKAGETNPEQSGQPAPAQPEAITPQVPPAQTPSIPAERKPEKSGSFLQWLWRRG
ncbi:hypothetical protein H4684_004022 [Desulfomicrobium macestii]|uniref:Uncharacterized protein n=1 Tax=Desulfomicrobium macestii TaxID=90731 RepID=A0ABR9H9F3_9BACT|nr:hypothetical protein [Desulfomicrobium macestii]MBE1427329.1 hypothetical protein [Desulfomicrobium macestii]